MSRQPAAKPHRHSEHVLHMLHEITGGAVGVETSRETLRAAVGIPAAQFDAALQDLAQRGWVVLDAAGSPALTLRGRRRTEAR